MRNVLFLVIINSITIFQLIPPMEIAKECVYILMNLFKSFLWVADGKGICHVAMVRLCACPYFVCVTVCVCVTAITLKPCSVALTVGGNILHI